MMTHIQKCLAAYDHVLKILQINNDNYFKRTQILMTVVQSALFVAFAKLLTLKNSDFLLFTECIALIALFVITLLGQVSALLWVHFGRRQNNVLNLCKFYLRGIEKTLMRLGVPSGYWTFESMISRPGSNIPHLDSIPWQGERFKIGLTKIERGIAWLLWLFWVVLAFPVGLWASNKLWIVLLVLWIVPFAFGLLMFFNGRFLSRAANSKVLRWLIKRI